MYAPERRALITKLVQERERMSVHELAEHLQVTPETVRKDLTELEAHGLLERTHGGAVRVDRLSYFTPVTQRMGLRLDEKRAIAHEALRLIRPDDTIAIDAGTTTIHLAQAIPATMNLTVVTYSILVASALVDRRNVNVYMLGGQLRENSRAAVGGWAEDQLRQVTVDHAFLGVDGIDTRHGLTTHNLAEARVKALMVQSARSVTVLADSSKFGRQEFARVDDLSGVNTIVTDSGVAPHWAGDLAQHDVALVVTHPESGARVSAPRKGSADRVG